MTKTLKEANKYIYLSSITCVLISTKRAFDFYRQKFLQPYSCVIQLTYYDRFTTVQHELQKPTHENILLVELTNTKFYLFSASLLEAGTGPSVTPDGSETGSLCLEPLKSLPGSTEHGKIQGHLRPHSGKKCCLYTVIIPLRVTKSSEPNSTQPCGQCCRAFLAGFHQLYVRIKL